MLKNFYWYFQSALTDKWCDSVIKFAESKENNYGLISGVSKKGKQIDYKKLDDKAKKKLFKKRKSKVAWLDEPWVYNEVSKFVKTANQNAGWNFVLKGVEYAQFTTYDLKDYYGWHSDTLSSSFENDHMRKLSVTVSLTDPKEYKGGELEFDFRDDEPNKKSYVTCKEILPRGSIVVFPSFIWHRVKPVTKGQRQSLVMWFSGPNFV